MEKRKKGDFGYLRYRSRNKIQHAGNGRKDNNINGKKKKR